jgi:hypothetical protein
MAARGNARQPELRLARQPRPPGGSHRDASNVVTSTFHLVLAQTAWDLRGPPSNWRQLRGWNLRRLPPSVLEAFEARYKAWPGALCEELGSDPRPLVASSRKHPYGKPVANTPTTAVAHALVGVTSQAAQMFPRGEIVAEASKFARRLIPAQHDRRPRRAPPAPPSTVPSAF